MATPAAFPPIAPLIRLIMRLVVSMAIPPGITYRWLVTSRRGARAGDQPVESVPSLPGFLRRQPVRPPATLSSGIVIPPCHGPAHVFEVDRHTTNHWWQELSKVTEGWA